MNLLAASGQGCGAPWYLLLFYAAECGLKSAYLQSNSLWSTKHLDNPDHDLDDLIKKLKLSAAAVGSPPIVRLRRPPEVCPHSSAHQAWRYGVRISEADEAALVGWLQRVCRSVKERL